MRKQFIKFSDERNKKYSIETIIATDASSKDPLVLKTNVYPEGKEHMENILHYSEILPKAYPECTICPVKMREDGYLEFAYIKGKALNDIYQESMQSGDEAKMEETLALHKKIIESCPENHCAFHMTEDFEKTFGKEGWDEGEDALAITNLDATASNVKIEDGQPVFIDYEWVFEFPIPVELAVYYGVRDAYYHVDKMEAFYPLEKALDYLGVTKEMNVLEDAIAHFYAAVVCESDGSSYGLSKHINLKGTQTIEEIQHTIEDVQQSNMDLHQAIAFAEKNWKEACQANASLSGLLQKDQQEIASMKEAYAQDIQEYQAQINEQNNQIATWRTAYETVINSRSWRLISKLKRLVGKK